jgi:glucose-1-phosphate adenylyltransferase
MSLETLVIVLAGGAGTRLKPLTKVRTKPAVPIGGKYRLIDIPLSNAFNSNLMQVLVLTQGYDESLNIHIKNTWHSDAKTKSFVHTISPQGLDERYEGDADAVRQIIRNIKYHDPTNVLIVPGDHQIKMDFSRFINYLNTNEADVAIPIIPRPKAEANRLGAVIMDSNRIKQFDEKNPNTKSTVPDKPDMFYASMGIYAFKKNTLLDALGLEGNLFGKQILPQILSSAKVIGYNYVENNIIEDQVRVYENGYWVTKMDVSKDSPYWMDVGTIESYFEASMDLVNVTPRFNLYGKKWPFYTFHHEIGPAKIINLDTRPDNSIVGEGSILSNISGKNMVISPLCYINQSHLEDVVVMHNSDIQQCRIRRTILDKDIQLRGIEVGYDEDVDRNRGIYIDPVSKIRVIQKGYQSDDPSTWETREEIEELVSQAV